MRIIIREFEKQLAAESGLEKVTKAVRVRW